MQKPNAQPKIAFYLRVSTQAQDFPAQLLALREFCRRQKWRGPPASAIFSEKASGAKTARRELDRLLQACRDGVYDTIITYRGDRLGRSFEHMAIVYQELRHAGIRVIGAADGIDTASETPATRALQRVLTVTAEMQREMIVENTRDGIRAARKRRPGRTWGRPRKNEKAIAALLKAREAGGRFIDAWRKSKLSKSYAWLIWNSKPEAAA